MYPVLELAKYIVVKCINEQYPISNLQLQKILYYIQREFLQRKGVAAFPESIEAWTFGPVVPKVYYYFCGAGVMPITLCRSFDSTKMILKPEEKKVIDTIIQSKRLLNPWDLVAETHKPGGAWAKVYKSGLGERNVISVADMRKLG